MEALYEALRFAQLVVFTALAGAALWQWRRRGGAPAAWLAATFTLLASVLLLSRLLPEGSDAAVVLQLRKFLVALLALFPYFLYRFTVAIIPPVRWILVASTIVTGGLFVWAMLLPRIPEGAEPRPLLFREFLYALLLQWVILTLRVAYLLWRAGRDQPTVARRRMRTLSLGGLGIAMALVLAAAASPTEEVTALRIATQLFALISGPLFVLGFAPPGFVRTLWRRPETARLRDAEAALMEAIEPVEVARVLLPHVVRLVAGRGAVIVDGSGEVIGSRGLDEAEAARLIRETERSAAGEPDTAGEGATISVPLGTGRLLVLASPFMPFFGPEEMDMLQHLAFLGELALTRSELFQRERRTHDLLVEAQQLARMGSWEWDIPTNRVLWSDEMYRIYGLERGTFELTYEAAISRLVAEDRPFVEEETRSALATRQPFELEYRINLDDGSIVHLHSRGKVILDEGGHPIKMIGTVQDVTERKQAEALRDQQARVLEEQAELLDHASDAIFAWNLGRTIEYWNAAAERLYGWSKEEAVGRNVDDLLRTQFPETLEAILEKLFRQGNWEGELTQDRRSGGIVVVETRWGLQRDAKGAPIRVMEINTDISERKQQEAFRNQFIANAAHELRTPLTTMLGFIELLSRKREDLSDDHRAAAYEALSRSGDRLRRLVVNLLDLTKLQQGQLQVTVKPVDVAQIARATLESTPPPEGTSVDVAMDGNVQALADPARLDQIFSNLLTNAYRYGGREICLKAHAENGHVLIAVSDDGPGVDADVVDHLFDPFTRAQKAASVGGSGLGLAISKMLAEACDGSIWYEPGVPKGAHFYVRLRSAS